MYYYEKSLEYYLARTIYMLAIINDLSLLKTFCSTCTIIEIGSLLLILGSTFMFLY